MSTSLRSLTDRAAFERFKETHPELGSALKIAAIETTDFVQTYADELDGGKREAYRIHQVAVRVQQQAALVWANLKDAASPLLQQTLFNNIPQAFLDQQAKIPGYDRLFGNLDFIECDESRSVLSPAAYFVDLMRFIEENITAGSSIPEDCQIDRRRADLSQLRLDEDNTFDLIPYIDLVNEVLETLVIASSDSSQEQAEEGADAESVAPPLTAEALVEAAVFPQSLPLNLPLAEIRAYLSQLDWDLPQVYDTFATASDDQQAAIQRERLALSPQELALLGNPLVDEPDQLAAVYGFKALDVALSELTSVEVFLERTGLSRQDLTALVFQDLDRFEVNAGLSRLFFINAVEDGLGQLGIEANAGNPDNPTQPPAEALLNLSAAKLDRIYRFLKLARRLEWSFADLDWALRSQSAPYLPEPVLRFDGLNDFVDVPPQGATTGDDRPPTGLAALGGNFSVEAWVNPAYHQANPILARGIEDNPDVHFLLCLDRAGRVGFYGAPAAPVTSLQALTAGEFAHVAVTVETAADESTIRIYINGQLDQTAPLPAVLPPTGDLAVNIGRNLSDQAFAGLIKDVRVWAEVRSPAAIADGRYRRLTGFETNLAAYWPLTQSHGVELLDRTPYGQHGMSGGTRYVTQPRWASQDLVLEALPERLGNVGYHFNGVDHYLAARGVTGLAANEFTLEAWISVAASGHNSIISKGNAGNRQAQFLLWVDEQNRLVFRSTSLGSQAFRGQTALTLDTLTHVAVTVSDRIRLYINGQLDSTHDRPAGAIDPRGDDLLIGNDFSDRYFSGVIQEVRVWNHGRSAIALNNFLQRTVPPLAPGLIGYWRLDQVVGEQATDRSSNGNHLYLGGIPEDFRPDVVAVAPLLPELPMAVPGPVLQFDGDQDLLVLSQSENFGLGRYPCFTLEFWFKPTHQDLHPETPQLLFSQGDGEAGLGIYLQQGQLIAIAWCADYTLTEVQETVLGSAEDAVIENQWHHVAIVHDETQSLDYIELRGLLNGVALAELESTHSDTALRAGQRGYRLSPVGPAWLGGIDATGTTRFQGAYLQPEAVQLHGFAGQITDLRLWNQARAAATIEQHRHQAPAPDAIGLLAYLPLDEGQDIAVGDRVDGYSGLLRGKDSVFLSAPRLDPELENRYSHYAPEGEAVLDWSNYVYSGSLYVPQIPEGETTGGLGVTFLSRHPQHIDQFYRLQVTWSDGQPAFSLAAHPLGIQPLTLERDNFPTPTPDTWYAFRIQVTDNAADSRTDIAVTVWPEDSRKPRSPQVRAFDASDVRLTTGTVGVWVAGDQPQSLTPRFNNLRVAVLRANNQAGEVLLSETFKSYLPGENPTGWIDTGDRLTPQDAAGLFSALELNGSPVLVTDSDLNGIHSHYAPADRDGLSWSAYTYRGKLRFSDPDSGIGLTFLSRTPEGVDQYYALRREAGQSFQLVAHPLGVQPLTAEPESSLDAGLIPAPDTDYFVRVVVEVESDRTQIRARVWEAGTPESEAFEMQAFDDSDIRIMAGTVGVWTAGPGTKTFADLKVLHEVLLVEDFSTYAADQDPTNWLDTAGDNSRTEDPALFKTVERDGNIVFGPQNTNRSNIHSHYQASEALAWTSYTYTGRMMMDAEADSMGVTFFSRYTDPELNRNNHDQYYRLRRNNVIETLHIAPHPHEVRQVNRENRNGRERRDTGLNPAVDTWYRFLIEAHEWGDRTLIRAKVWPEGTPEPAEFQADTFDNDNSNNRNRARLRAGTVGIWSARGGKKFYDDLRVQRGIYLTAGLDLEDWQATGSRNAFEPDDTLFVTERIPDHPLWLAVEDVPLLRQPLNLTALEFDGSREYLALAALNGVEAESFTLEAWIQPRAADRANPIASWGAGAGWGLSDAGRLSLNTPDGGLSGAQVLATDTFTHVAVSVDGTAVTLYINGEVDGQGTLTAAGLVADAGLEVGRSPGQVFGGQIRDLRLWSGDRSEFPIVQRYQTPDLQAADLLCYWAFGEFQEAYTLDASAQQNHLRLGGLESARKPTLQERSLATDGDFWQQPHTILSFSEPHHGMAIPPVAERPPAQRQTIEIWVRVNDPFITLRKQVIYHSGDAEQGLVIYAHDGRLHCGGYDLANGWSGTWLSSDRLQPQRWHHIALVLDGRGEVRPAAFRAYLDGHLLGLGDGAALTATLSAGLGAAIADLRFHDGEASAADTYLEGAVLELRLWETARTSAEIADFRYVTLAGDEPDLTLWWRFAGIDPATLQILDGSGSDRHGVLDAGDRLHILAPFILASPPAPTLSPEALQELATFRLLMERHRQSVERLAALWYDLRHTGRADQRVFFDQVFNPQGLERTLWGYHDDARRWDVTGQELPSRDRAIRSRLMAALQVSSDELDVLVTTLSGEESPIELDIAYLRQLYALSQIPKVLRLSLREYFVVLGMLEMSGVASVLDLSQVSDRLLEIRRIGLSLDGFNFLANDVISASIPLPYTDTDIRALADEVANQTVEFLITQLAFVAADISELESSNIVDFFRPAADTFTVGVLTDRYFIDDLGAVSDRYQTPADLRDLAINQNWAAPFVALGEEIFTALQEAGLVSDVGIILRPEELDEFPDALGDDLPNPTVLAAIQAALENQNNRQSAITETLVRSRDEHRNALLAGLAELLSTNPEPLQAIVAYFQSVGDPLSDPARLLEALLRVEETQPIAADLQDYLYRLAKILFLVTQFELTTAEVQLLLTHPDCFSVSDVFRPTLTDLTNLFTFGELRAAFGGQSEALLELLQTTTQAATRSAILTISGWDAPQLEALIDHFGPTLAYNRVENLILLQRGFALAESGRVDVGLLLDLADTRDLTLDFYRQQADALLPVLRALYDDEQWPRVYRPLRDPLAVQKRDALLALALEDIPDNFDGRRSPDLLSEYLLLDVQVGSEVETSRILQAVAALQLYVQRGLMNLEKGVDPANIPADQWAWMRNYRVWEANRKVFLYPESYIEPELRDTKTPIFEALEQALMQMEISQESATQAYASYLNSFTELATLRIVGAYRHKNLSDATADEVLYLVGRTNTEPRVYYYRELVNEITWRPWQKIDLTIAADFVSPVFAFGRLFLFWVEFEEFSETVGTDNEDTAQMYRPSIRYSFPDFNGNWRQPQTYDVSIQGADEVQNAFDAAHSAHDGLQAFIGDLNLGNVERSEFNAVNSQARDLATQIDAAAAAVDQVGVRSPRFASELTPISTDIRNRASTLREAVNELERQVNQFAEVLFFNITAFRARFISVAIAQVSSAAQATNDAIDAAFITLNTVVTVDLVLSEAQRREQRWQRVYAQHAEFNPPVPPATENELNARVLQMMPNATITNRLPIFASMTNLTWSFWVNFVNSHPDGSTRRVETTIELFNYAARRLRVTATNLVSPLNDLPAAVEAARASYGQISNILNAGVTEAEVSPLDSLLGQAADQTQAIIDNAAIGSTPDTVIDELRSAIRGFRSHQTQLRSGRENLDINALLGGPIELGGDALGDVVRFVSPGVRLSVQLDQAVVPSFDLPYGEWRHLALVMTYAAGTYSLTVHQHRTDREETTTLATVQVPAEILPGTQPLVIAGAIASVPDGPEVALLAQLSEFRAWDRARSPETIRQERNQRVITRQAGLFRLALNRQLANTATLTLVLSTLRFTVQLPFQAIEPRERIVLFFGGDEIIRTRRNNLDEQSFTLTLEPNTPPIPHHDVAISAASELYIAQNTTVITDTHAAGDGPSDANFLINNLPVNEATVLDVQNQPGWYILATGDEQFLMQARVSNASGFGFRELLTTEERLVPTYGSSSSGTEPQALSLRIGIDGSLDARAGLLPRYSLERLSSFAIESLSVRLFEGGIDSLLTPEAQGTAEVNFDRYDYNDQLIIPPIPFNGLNDTINFDGALGLYYYEIFFHIPFFIANQLNTNQNFAEAQEWYHYIFNPTVGTADNSSDSNPNNRYWRFIPFRDLPLEPLSAILNNDAALEAYRNDPFDPHTIARLRINAYQKAVVMKYIDNLLDWADNLFLQDTREAINEAFLLYVLAFNLLGPRPEARAARTFEAIGSYEGIREAFEQDPDVLPDFLTEVALNGSNPDVDLMSNGSITLTQNGRIVTTFCVPENADFMGFWDRVEDRLFKIRHSLNIEGTFRQLALFQPPLDVRALVQAVAGGRDIGSLLSDLNVPVPHYRYSFMLDRAKEMIGNVKDLGSALLEVLEKRDAEELAILQTNQERQILELTTRVRETVRDQAQLSLEVLRISEQRVQERISFLNDLIDEFLIPEEIAGLTLMGTGNITKLIGSGLRLGASIAYNVPDATTGGAGIASPVVVTTFGGGKVAEGLTRAAEVTELIGDGLILSGAIVDKVGEYVRRANGWRHDREIAQFDLAEVQEQIESAELQLQMAERELAIHHRQIEQNQEIARFYRNKFTNQALYSWMVSRLSGLYFQAYKLAYDFAKAAERGMQYELPSNERFINFGHWDSLRRGLLAGEALLLDLNRMEKFQLDNDSRFQEIEKIVPLSTVDPVALAQLIAQGSCEFRLSEALYNRDYPGHYFRVIKSISLSLRFPDGSELADEPFLSINASLTQVGNKTLLDPDIDAVRYLLGIDGASQPSGSTLRVNWRSNQQIAVSSPRRDNGMFGSFDLNFVFDDRYFPFEGTGAVSNWHLEIPRETNPALVRQVRNNDVLAIADVIIHIQYTSKFERGEFRTQVQEEMQAIL